MKRRGAMAGTPPPTHRSELAVHPVTVKTELVSAGTEGQSVLPTHPVFVLAPEPRLHERHLPRGLHGPLAQSQDGVFTQRFQLPLHPARGTGRSRAGAAGRPQGPRAAAGRWLCLQRSHGLPADTRVWRRGLTCTACPRVGSPPLPTRWPSPRSPEQMAPSTQSPPGPASSFLSGGRFSTTDRLAHGPHAGTHVCL